jgi:hypothetical protein
MIEAPLDLDDQSRMLRLNILDEVKKDMLHRHLPLAGLDGAGRGSLVCVGHWGTFADERERSERFTSSPVPLTSRLKAGETGLGANGPQ